MYFHVLPLGVKTYHLCTNSRLTYLATGFIYTLHIYTLSLECSLTIAVGNFRHILQRPVHTRLAFIPLHLPLHAVLHPQWISS